jgi:hypothetical protein
LTLYSYRTAIGVFQIRQEGNYFVPLLDGQRLGTNTYIHPQFVVDDLVTGVIEIPGTESDSTLGLPDDLSEWALVDD